MKYAPTAASFLCAPVQPVPDVGLRFCYHVGSEIGGDAKLPLKPSRQMCAGFRVYPQGKHIWGVSRQMLTLGVNQEAAALRDNHRPEPWSGWRGGRHRPSGSVLPTSERKKGRNAP